MKTVFSIFFLTLIGFGATYLSVTALNVAGLPGGLIALIPGRRRGWRLAVASAVSTVGQAYVYLAFTAFVVGWTRACAHRDDVVGWVLWPVAFLAAIVPVYGCVTAARHEVERPEDVNPQVVAIHVTLLLALISFFVFAFWPRAAGGAWGWIPFAAK